MDHIRVFLANILRGTLHIVTHKQTKTLTESIFEITQSDEQIFRQLDQMIQSPKMWVPV